jgi:YidC/Oxa1 family membrane protein insertase
MREDNKNLLLAIILSAAVLMGWNLFVAPPQPARPPQATTAQQNGAAQPGGLPQLDPGLPSPSQAGGPAPPLPGTLPAGGQPETREAALARSPRVAIDTPSIRGSINLRGGRVDDVVLKTYRETVDPKSANIVLLSPQGGPNPYYADFGWATDGTGGAPNANTVWTADRQTLTPDQPVTLTFDNGQGLVFRRVIAVDARSMFTVKDTVENRTGQDVRAAPYSLVARHGKPTTLGYYVLHEGLIGVAGDQGLQEYTYDDLNKEAATGVGTVKAKAFPGIRGGFMGITDKYWATATIPDQDQAYTGRFVQRDEGATRIYQADVQGEMRTVPAGGAAETTQRLFAGAKEVAVVDGYQASLGIKNFDLVIDWGWFYFITKPLFKVLDYFFRLLGNFGVAILIVTVLLKILFFPLANKSYASMAKMKAVQPEMLAIRERYADDKMKQQQALMELYKKEKINPVAGCWPVLIQIPVFFALYKVLFVTIEMRHAPFFGWIRDLAAPDPTSIFNLFGLLPFAVPAFLLVGVWPILMGITMFVQMKMNPDPPDPIQKAMFSWMPVVFTFMLASFPAGLVIYWAWNNLLSVLQQGYIMRKNGVKIELWDNIRGMLGRKALAKG